MRTIPLKLQSKLDSGVTTLCRCWTITRTDGVRQGFTDHDADVALGDIVCRAGTGLAGSEATQKLGLSVDSSEISGALSDETLNEIDLVAGRYDAASVSMWLVDWSEPELRVLLAKGSLGEVRRDGTAFSAELRGLSEAFSQQSGRLYSSDCAADLGDLRCKIDLADPAFRGNGVIESIGSSSTFTATGLGDFADGWFMGGKLSFTSGANAGLSVEVKSHRRSLASTLVLWQQMPHALSSGDRFVVTAGCDKRFQTCHERFNNVLNFRGFPHMPGNDFVISYPLPGEPGNDGSSRRT